MTITFAFASELICGVVSSTLFQFGECFTFLASVSSVANCEEIDKRPIESLNKLLQLVLFYLCFSRLYSRWEILFVFLYQLTMKILREFLLLARLLGSQFCCIQLDLLSSQLLEFNV